MKRLSIIFNCLLLTMSVFSQGSGNTATGYHALNSNTTGNGNTATGYEALTENTAGSYNSAHGLCALRFYDGNYNTANGHQALQFAAGSSSSGYRNTADGYGAFSYCYGIATTAAGYFALRFANYTAEYITTIGYQTYSVAYSNTTTIGAGTTVDYNYQIRIGGAPINSSGATISSVNSIGGFVTWTNISDGRTKKNIRKDVPGLAFINRLQPVTYNFDLDAMDQLLREGKDVEIPPALSPREKAAREIKEKRLYTGFVAQDVEKAAQGVGYDFSGIDVEEGGMYALRYAEFVVPLVKAVQEYSEQNDALQDQVDKLTVLVNQLLESKNKRALAIAQP